MRTAQFLLFTTAAVTLASAMGFAHAQVNSSSNPTGATPNQLDTRPNPIGTTPNPIGTRQNQIGTTPNQIGTTPNPVDPFNDPGRPSSSGANGTINNSAINNNVIDSRSVGSGATTVPCNSPSTSLSTGNPANDRSALIVDCTR